MRFGLQPEVRRLGDPGISTLQSSPDVWRHGTCASRETALADKHRYPASYKAETPAGLPAKRDFGVTMTSRSHRSPRLIFPGASYIKFSSAFRMTETSASIPVQYFIPMTP